MSKRRGTVSLRLTDNKDGTQTARVLYRGREGRRAISNARLMRTTSPDNRALITGLMEEAYNRVRMPTEVKALQ